MEKIETTLEVIEALMASGSFFQVDFIKKDGTASTLNGRMGVKKHLRGGERTTDPEEYIIVYAVDREGYRNVAKSRIVALRINSQEYVPVKGA